MSDKLKDKIANLPTFEKRYHKSTVTRMEGDENKGMQGSACKMEVEYDMGWYKEIVHRGAFDNALSNSDARCLVNHKSDNLIGRQSANTLTVKVEGDELRYYVEELPNTTIGNNLKVNLERGEIKESSFQFTINKQRWEERQDGDNWEYVRHIDEVDRLLDVGPVTFPANPDTTAAKRAFDAFKEASVVPQVNYKLNNRKKRMQLL